MIRPLGKSRLFIFVLVLSLSGSSEFGATRKTRKRTARPAASTTRFASTRTTRAAYALSAGAALFAHAVIAGGPWTEPTYGDPTAGDNVDGDDLEIRRAAVEALGTLNGSAVVVDAD